MASFHDFDSRYAVLFDLDGTIIDSRQGIISTLHHVIQTLGHQPDPSVDLTWVVGPPLSELMAHVLAHYGEDRVERAVEIYRARYQVAGRFDTPLFPGMAKLLRDLAASPVRLYTATSKPAFLARDILEMHGLENCFDRICGANDDDSGGEKPEMIARILAEYKASPERALMIGDRRFDINGAHANKLRTVGVLWGYGGEKELTEAGADVLVAEPQDLDETIRAQLHALARVRV
ncbi:HAD hydrolase-like protein [Kozakia baliensis]|uniref:HAD hydrolase-like protein n=1 Tax=Kozakia baliensis TaxID=153496 RepID=UPI000497D82E|nr:HAD hydrolase-like protein [Kozakia baliensis]